MFDHWANVSSRERRLATIGNFVVVLSIVYLGFLQAADRIATMNATMDALEQKLVFYSEQMGQLDEVDRAYSAIASEHSSEWTQEQIHDRLRREIARLSLVNAPSPVEGATLSGSGQRLVDIREMPQGHLSSSESGYREYRIDFRTEPTSIQNITKFIERLHESPQALRVASLDLTRSPNRNNVTARIHVIRSVIDTEDTPTVQAHSAPTEQSNSHPGLMSKRESPVTISPLIYVISTNRTDSA